LEYSLSGESKIVLSDIEWRSK